MHVIKSLNKILLTLMMLVAMAAGSVYGWSTWRNGKHDSVDVQIAAKEKLFKRQEAQKKKDAELAVLGKSDTNEKEQGQQDDDEEGEVVLPGEAESAGKDIFQEESETPVDSFTFVAIGDSEDISDKGYEQELPALLKAAKAQGPDLAFFTGDIVAMDTPYSSDNRLRVKLVQILLQNDFVKSYLVFGQHDIACGNQCIDAWYNIFFQKHFSREETRKLYHSFDYGNTHFVLLSSNYPQNNMIDDDQLAWLEQDLAATKQTHKIVFSHVPPVNFFQKSADECYDMSCNVKQQQDLVAVLKKHQVDLVISGNENAFDHRIVDGIDYVLSGNSGNSPRHEKTIRGNNYSLVTITKEKILLKAMDVGGKVLREIEIK